MSTEHYQFFSQSLEEIRSKVSDDLHINQLLLANVVTVFEYYLQSILVSLVQADKKLLLRLAGSRNSEIKLSLFKSYRQSYAAVHSGYGQESRISQPFRDRATL